MGRLGLFVVALLVGLAAPQLLQIADASLQLPLLLGIGQQVLLQVLLQLVELLQGHGRLLPRLPQLRIPTGQALLQICQSRLQPLTQGLQFLVVGTLLSGLVLIVLTLLGRLGLFVVALLVGLAALQLL